VGFSGFGFALIALPLLSLFLDVKFAVPLELLLSSFCLVVLSLNKLKFLKGASVYLILGGMLAGLGIGAHALAHFEVGFLKKALGVVVVLFAMNIFLRARGERKAGHAASPGGSIKVVAALPVGLLAGLAGGVFGTSGPPLVVYMDYFADDKSAFRAQLLVLFLLQNLIRVFLYLRYSLLTTEVATFAVWMLPALCLGLFAGSKMHFQMSEKVFSSAVASMLFVSGMLLLIR